MKFQIEISAVLRPPNTESRDIYWDNGVYKWDLQVIDSSSTLDIDYDGSYSESGTSPNRKQAYADAKHAAVRFLETLAENNNTETFQYAYKNIKYEIEIISGVGDQSGNFKDNFKWTITRTDKKLEEYYDAFTGSGDFQQSGYSRSKAIARTEAMAVIREWLANPPDCDVYTLDVSDLWELS